ncbi:DNA polymerase Eta [Diaporthe helianthi]|uniref:DNA polymerase eta n=1 Tax=Diaporthe helianthi TaxID=158607 RepID=A0A2P5HPM7_DIAHE|nr:DNA polymerase Eta [Diaporthe helianthi]
MSSSPPDFRGSSPAGAPGRARSQFSYRHLNSLASYSTSSPLRVIAHVDLDAFYAQCEMRRLEIPDDQPLAVQQWQGLIAVNYPARDRGVGRFTDIAQAKELCDNLICQHVATWREGQEHWAYRDDHDVSTDKVSLDPYRLQSRKILALIKESLPQDLQKVEKASIDEVFLDLSAQVHAILLDRFPDLRIPPYDDPTERLPMPPVTALDWKADALIDLDDTETEMDDPDWNDVALLIGSEIVRDVREAIRAQLKYTCSAGVASNKMLSKLGSGYKKPNGQTVIRHRAIRQFLSGFKFTKIRNLGGKLGEQIAQTFNTESIGDLLLVSVEQFKSKLGDDTGVWVHNTIRGIDNSEVNPRVQIKSMLSAKSFRPSINSVESAIKWLRIFVSDIFSRLVEEGVVENKRRPRSINLHHRHGGQTRSRQGPIPQGKPINKELLLELAKNLLNQVVLEGKVWPCANLSLSVGGFDEGITGNMGIGAFLVKGEEAQSLKRSSREGSVEEPPSKQPEKHRKFEKEGIQRFFSRSATTRYGDEDRAMNPATGWVTRGETSDKHVGNSMPEWDPADAVARNEASKDSQLQEPSTYLCRRCDTVCEDAEELQCHQDEHLARDFYEEERGSHTFAGNSALATTGNSKGASATTKRPAKRKKMEAGQSKLNFG